MIQTNYIWPKEKPPEFKYSKTGMFMVKTDYSYSISNFIYVNLQEFTAFLVKSRRRTVCARSLTI
jgi:hypothetical protein